MKRTVIFNADDFGASVGINRGIMRSHTDGVLTSASLMVGGPAAEDAARLAGRHPALAVGLHWDLDFRPAAPVDLEDAGAVRAELERQLTVAGRLLGRPPTHLDSHHHVHLEPAVEPIAREIARRVGLPLRGSSAVHYIGGFYAQWEPGVDELEHVSVAALRSILESELGPGWTELGCHPGFIDEDFRSGYREPRAAEVATLTDPAVRSALDALGLRLASFAEVDCAEG
ncbi:MAG: carbohydrate deacetylase [Solirubrobacteraceae bacterium]